MKTEFIPYEQALALKELGFDEPCFGKWLSSLQSNWKDYELILEMGMNEEFEDNKNVYLLDKVCSAPTFSQAFRWFREKYGMEGQVKSWKEKGGIIWHYSVQKIGEPSIFRSIDCSAPTYEEAELACLIKLIEIVKNNE